MNKGKFGKKGRMSADDLLQKLKDKNSCLSTLEEFFNKSYCILDYSSCSLQDVTQTSPCDVPNSPLEFFFTQIPSFIGELKRVNEELRVSVIDPFQKHKTEHFSRSKKIIERISSISSEINELRKNVERHKEEYFKASSQLEKAETALAMVISSIENGNLGFNSRVEAKTRLFVYNALDEVLAFRKVTEEKRCQYEKIVNSANTKIKENQTTYDRLMAKILKLSFMCEILIKEVLGKYVALLEKSTKQLLTKVRPFGALVGNMKAEGKDWEKSLEYDTMFADVSLMKYESTYCLLLTCRGAYIFPETENIISVKEQETQDETIQMLNTEISEDYFGNSDSPSLKEMKVEYEQCFDKLIRGKTLTRENYDQVIKEFQQPLARNTFITTLKQYASVVNITSYEAFEMLSSLILKFLDELEKESSPNYKFLEAILQISRSFTAKVRAK
eukprot:TRINITY_DN2405_c0_g3_i1.p1 TRINITY_DN2405_c0_g3~~TRINITY_DN2405_c0_g3_i1.p1  ORF type:complete len:445 (-),score=105.26 TRINITY_DN2405_c0_g3_i1:95-1429(-)